VLPFSFSGSVHYISYVRETKKKLDLPKLHIGTPSEFKNILELTSLMIANN
jgi:hypothetical protein